MELIRLVEEIKEGFNQSGVIDDIYVVKDETQDIETFYREHKQGYMAFLQPLNINPDFTGKDTVIFSIGVSAISTNDDNDYFQVVAKSAYALKEAMKYVGYTKDNNLNEASFTVDATRQEDVIKILVYTSISIDINLAYGS